MNPEDTIWLTTYSLGEVQTCIEFSDCDKNKWILRKNEYSVNNFLTIQRNVDGKRNRLQARILWKNLVHEGWFTDDD